MKISDIEAVLSAEFKQVGLLLPEYLRERFDQYAYFAGGCIYCLYNDKEPKDYDIFVDDETYAREIQSYFMRFADRELRADLLAGTYAGCRLLISEYAITIGKYQIIIKYIGSPQDVIEQFDFRHNMFSFRNGKVENHTNWEHIASTALIFNEDRVRDICGTALRIPKFLDRGMTISRGEMIKILRALDRAGFNDNERKILKNNEHY